MKVQKSELLNLISPVVPIADAKSITVLSGLHFYGDGSALVAETTDLEVRSKRSLLLDEEPKIDVCVPAKKFLEIVKALPEGEVAFEIKEDCLCIQAGSVEFKLAVMDPADFPKPNKNESIRFVLEFPADVLARVLETAACAMAKKDARSVFCGLCFDFLDQDKPYAVATDGYRLALQELNPVKTEGIPEGQYVVPAKAVQGLASVLKKTSAAVKVAFSRSFAEFSWVDGSFVSELSAVFVEGQFPDWRPIVDQDCAGSIVVSPEQFISALKRVTLLTKDRYKPVLLVPQGDKLRVHFVGSEVDEAWEDVPAGFEGKVPEIKVNATYLLEVLVPVAGVPEIRLELKNEQSPIRIQEGVYTALVTPMIA